MGPKRAAGSSSCWRLGAFVVLAGAGYLVGRSAHTPSAKPQLRAQPRPRAAAMNSSGAGRPLPPQKVPAGFPKVRSSCGWPAEAGYPKTVDVADIIENWNPDETKLPAEMYSSLCRFDYETDLATALLYRDSELPFQIWNLPEANAVSRSWADPAHLRAKLGASTKYKCEASQPGGEANFGANHFMYTSGRSFQHKSPPITNVRLSFDDWLAKVDQAKNVSIDVPDTRFYFRFSASSPSDKASGWLFDELPFFQPRPSVLLKDPAGQRGIHCRFGMDGVIAEAHWDGSRNTIAQFYGRRRYILVDPAESCHMHLLPKDHPSGRHSAVDWSKPESWAAFPDFPTMQAHEVVQQPGDFLYLPTYYLHYIVSLEQNYQCNTRSGRDGRQTKVINQCTPGFAP
ncbi:hypothetical protein M885DRAFT_530652 [Pelagophyceae sp. CCMP2097]|nr:hypothetical protein M885DRAFT_530652 [Pelagophyceae sp. CCMP2097]